MGSNMLSLVIVRISIILFYFFNSYELVKNDISGKHKNITRTTTKTNVLDRRKPIVVSLMIIITKM